MHTRELDFLHIHIYTVTLQSHGQATIRCEHDTSEEKRREKNKSEKNKTC